MKAAVGWKSGEVRISQLDDFKHGDPKWNHIVWLQVSVDGTAELSGLRDDDFPPEARTAIGKLLWSMGFKRVRWTRRNPDGRVKLVEFDLERFADAPNQTPPACRCNSAVASDSPGHGAGVGDCGKHP